MSSQTAISELHGMFVQGGAMTASRWRERLGEPAFREAAEGLIWQSDGRRFLPGDGFEPAGPVSLAHPVEMDAPEILHWRALLEARRIRQPFRQIREPVVLRNGRLPGRARKVQSEGESYAMTDRYRGFLLPLRAVDDLEREGFRFIERIRWAPDPSEEDEVEVAHVVTPAGILYKCETDIPVSSLFAGGLVDASLVLGMFWPFEGVRLRTLNHVAAVLEEFLIPEMIGRDALGMLLPHLPGQPLDVLHGWRAMCAPDGAAARMLDRLIDREEGEA